MKRKLSDDSFDIDIFKNHTSSFGEYEEHALKIAINERESYEFLFSSGEEQVHVPDYLQPMLLPDFDYNKILTFKASDYLELSDAQCLFLTKLKYVLINNKDPSSRFEPYIQDLINDFFRECRLEDGRNLYMIPSSLRLYIKGEHFAAHIDKEGRRGEEIVWILGENKHRFDPRYRQGDIQLIASFIAAAQMNYAKLRNRLEPKILYGMKVIGDEFFFYKAELNEAYIRNLYSDFPESNFNVEKYPENTGLRLSNPQDRILILYLLYKLREYALAIPLYE
ncbi:hypothetical protein Unana1_08953 [Umbelopsis nana]